MSIEQLQTLISPALNEHILQNILQKSSGCENAIVNNIIIQDVNTTKGDSYLSEVTRFTINGSTEKKDGEKIDVSCPVFVKMLPKNIGRRKSFRSTDFFRNEAAFYNEVWEVLSNFQKSKNVQDPFLNLPICYSAVSDGVNDFIAMEDLGSQHYCSFNRHKELSYESVILIIQLFAKFHALSFAFNDQYPAEFKKFATVLKDTYFDESLRSWYSDYQKLLIHCCRDAIKKELPVYYLKKYNEVVENDLYGQLIAIANNTKKPLTVVTQGDAWVPNFLAKFDLKDQPLDIKMIDFQLARCASPWCDLICFLYPCTSYKLLVEHWDDIINEYYSVFSSFLVKLGSKSTIFSIDMFKEDMKKNALLGIGMAMECVPMQLKDDHDVPDLDEIQGDEAIPITAVWKIEPLKSSEGRKKLAHIFKHAFDYGLL